MQKIKIISAVILITVISAALFYSNSLLNGQILTSSKSGKLFKLSKQSLANSKLQQAIVYVAQAITTAEHTPNDATPHAIKIYKKWQKKLIKLGEARIVTIKTRYSINFDRIPSKWKKVCSSVKDRKKICTFTIKGGHGVPFIRVISINVDLKKLKIDIGEERPILFLSAYMRSMETTFIVDDVSNSNGIRRIFTKDMWDKQNNRAREYYIRNISQLSFECSPLLLRRSKSQYSTMHTCYYSSGTQLIKIIVVVNIMKKSTPDTTLPKRVLSFLEKIIIRQR